MSIRPIVAFLCGSSIVAAAFYLSGAVMERGLNLCFAFIFAVLIGALCMAWDRIFFKR